MTITRTRRDFLRLLGASAAAAAAAPVLASCSGSSDGKATGGGDMRRTLRIAAIGAPGEKLDPASAASVATWTGIYAVHESLVVSGPEGPRMMLADSVEPNDAADEWTVRLRRDARFSDGSPVTGEDVLASFAAIGKLPMKGMEVADIDVDGSTVIEGGARLRLTRPRADFIPAVLGMSSLVFKGGKLDGGLGSGPYVAARGDSAQGWTLPANEHFPAGRRISETLEIQAVADPGARVRAVESGAVDLALDLPPTAVRTLVGDDVEAWIPGAWDSKALAFVLNTRVAPFDDPEVRHAAKMVLDRRAMVDQVLDGRGSPGTDVLGFGFPGFPSDLHPAEPDLDAARRIFEKHGVTELTLPTAEFSPGMNDGADLAARRFGEAGVRVTVEKRDPATYFADLPGLRRRPFFAMYMLNRPLVAGLPFTTGSGGLMNNSGFGEDPGWDGKLAAAAARTDETGREAMLADLARTVHEDGGDLIWAFADEIHGRRVGVPDIIISQQVPVPYLP